MDNKNSSVDLVKGNVYTFKTGGRELKGITVGMGKSGFSLTPKDRAEYMGTHNTNGALFEVTRKEGRFSDIRLVYFVKADAEERMVLVN